LIQLEKQEIETYYRTRVPGLRRVQGSVRGPCPVHGGKDMNFAVEVETGQSFCHSQCNRGWDVFSLEMELAACDFIRAKAEVFRLVGRPAPSWQERDYVATYDYTDAEGNLLYQVVRKTPGPDGKKRFLQRRPNPNHPGKWDFGLGNVPLVPYRLPQFSTSDLIFVVEGEKDVHSLERVGLVATCNNGGAGNFKPELAPYFAAKRVAILADNDEVGRRHAEAVARLLTPTAANLKLVEIPDLPLKGDVSDFLASGRTGNDLLALYESAPDWNPEFQFEAPIPHENDKWLRSFGQAVHEAGGYEGFWRSLENEGIPTPFPGLTKKLGGLRNGEVYVIGARSGQGKTSLALQFAGTALSQRTSVLMFSMEMGYRDCFQRMAAIQARVDLSAYRRLKRRDQGSVLLAEYEEALRESTSRLARAPMYCTTKTGVTPEFLIEESKRMKAQAGIGLVIIDHMQLMGSTGKQKSEYEKFTSISRATKEIAVELDVPLILVSQVSRTNATERRTELEMNDLRGTGAIEEDAAGVLMLYYDSDDLKAVKNDPSSERMKRGPIKSWLKIAKNRYGASGTYEALWHMKALTRFDECERTEQHNGMH